MLKEIWNKVGKLGSSKISAIVLEVDGDIEGDGDLNAKWETLGGEGDPPSKRISIASAIHVKNRNNIDCSIGKQPFPSKN